MTLRRRRPSAPEALGVVDAWFGEEGWGVIVSAEVEGRVFAHFSAIDGIGYRVLSAGQTVRFRYWPYGHDGCEWMARDIRPS